MWTTRLLALEQDMRTVKMQLTQLTTTLVGRVVEASAGPPPMPTPTVGADEIRQVVLDALSQTLHSQAKEEEEGHGGVVAQVSDSGSDTSDSDDDGGQDEAQQEQVTQTMNLQDVDSTETPLMELKIEQLELPEKSRRTSVPEESPVRRILLPNDFEIETKDPLPVAWRKWCCGDAKQGIPPLRSIRGADLPSKANQRRFSDLRCAMQPIEMLARDRLIWSETLTEYQADDIFQRLQQQDDLDALGLIASQRTRKREVAWSTALNAMRRHKKRKQQQQQQQGQVGSSEVV
ncbi:hypothetical protein PINS_up004887 [Pythium insidiosum]|nr:hypothetical protein PINS_up004887 [Pythium insidiosum]